MSKAFSPLSLGVGFTALLALIPGLGLGTQATKPTPKASAEAKGPVDPKKDPKLVALTALLDQCVKDSPRPPGATVDVTILTLPDPQRTNMAFWFDLRLNAVQRAFKACDFLPRAFFLPWEAKSTEPTGTGVSSDFPDPSPGLVWFAKGGPVPAYHALFIVGESQSLGINREAMDQAFRLAAKLPGQDSRRLAILGPQFSGSLSSLGGALEAHLKNPSAAPVRVQGTTTLDPNGIKTLKEAVGPVDPRRLEFSPWICNLSGDSKERLLRWYLKEAGWPDQPSKVAIFTESNTAYGSSNPSLQAQAAMIPFPMGLSRLRSERRAMEQNLAKGNEPELVLPSTLLGPAEDDAARVRDTMPQYAADTVRNTELTLAGTILSLARRGYTHIGISASDPEDLIFLAERIRAYHPSCTLFTTSGNHLLFAHPNISHSLDGMVLFGGYPLTDPMRALSLMQRSLASPVRFTSEGEYAAYYATLLRLDPARAQGEFMYWGKQGFVSIVKSGSIWPLRHGGVETLMDGKLVWDPDMEARYREVSTQSPDLRQYAYSRLPQLTVLLLLLGLTSWLVFLKPLLEVAGEPEGDLSLMPYRNLLAGALLALAIVSFLAVGYLLPLAVLKGEHWKQAFVWSGIGIWALLAVLTALASRGRLGWAWSLPLILLALGPAVAVGQWGRMNFLIFVPSYLRFTSPGRGVSLIPTLVMFSAGLAVLLRTWYDVRRQDHDAFWPTLSGIVGENGKRPGFPHLRGLRFQYWIGGLLVLLVALQAVLSAGLLHPSLEGIDVSLRTGLVRPLLEGAWVTLLAIAAGGLLFLASCFLFWQLHRGWRELRNVIEDLDFGTYRAAFEEAGRLMNWNAMRALGRGLKTHRSSRRGRELLRAQVSWAGPVVPGFEASLEALEALEAQTPHGRRGHSQFEKWKFRSKVAQQMIACGDALETACVKAPEAAALRSGEVDLLRALRAIHVIREGFLVMRHLLIGGLGSMILLVLGVAAFDFQPKGSVLMLLGAALAIMVGWIGWAILHIERDRLLCLMERSTAGEVNWSLGLIENGLRFVLIPAVLLLATLNPTFGGLFLQVFNPLMHLLK